MGGENGDRNGNGDGKVRKSWEERDLEQRKGGARASGAGSGERRVKRTL